MLTNLVKQKKEEVNNLTRMQRQHQLPPSYSLHQLQVDRNYQAHIESDCPPKESVEGDDTVLRGSVRAPEEFSEGKPEAAKPRGRSPPRFCSRGFA